MRTNNKGFTLIELVMVIVILGILAAVAIPKFANLSENATKSTLQGAVGALKSGAVSYLGYSEDHVYPNIATLTTDGRRDSVVSSDDFTIVDADPGGTQYGDDAGYTANLWIEDNSGNYVPVAYDEDTGTVTGPTDWSKQ